MFFYIIFLLIIFPNSYSSTKLCDPGEFLCQNGKCIQKSSFCDGINTCGDNSDEILCPKTCNPQQFSCVNDKNTCLSLDKKCDGKYDCTDKSDEKDCDKPCEATEFSCKNGKCISLKFRCDRDDDCGDRSDESDCSYPQFNCSNHEFMCVKNSHCIPERWRCDGDIDCLDNSDEIDCENINSANRFYFTPKAGAAAAPVNVPISIWSGRGGGSMTSSKSTWRAPVIIRPFMSVNAYGCNDHEFRCNNGHCVMASWRCDGDTDCLDGSDEKNCTTITCHTYEFKCRNNKCIMGVLECNGANDCGDNSDEIGCGSSRQLKICDQNTEFDCGDFCIPYSKVCDGKNDCGEGQDEAKSCGINECAKDNGGCLQICRDRKIGYVCDCRPGYFLSIANHKTCLDVNECITTYGVCSQLCVNTPGSFRCECHANYTLYPASENSTFCKADGEHAKLLFANRRDIRMIDAVPLTQHSKYRLLVSELHSSVAIDFDVQTQRIYWSDVSSEKIYSTPLIEGKESEGYNTNSIETVVEGDLNMPDGISIDWIYRLIYWTDTGKNTIEVARLPPITAYSTLVNESSKKPPSKPGNSTTYGGGTILARMVLIQEDLDEPRAIIVDPRDRHIYWTDWGSKPRIEKCGSNGISRRVIVSQNIMWPNGLAIDYANNRLYWADAKLDQIVSSDLEGQNRLITIDSKKNIRHPFAITVFEDWIYWTDWENETLFSANKFTGGDLKPLARDLYSPMDVRVYHPLKQPLFKQDGSKIINVCGAYEYNGGCEHLCLPGPEHKYLSDQTNQGGQSALYVCACSTGYKIDPNDATKCIFQNITVITPTVREGIENSKVQQMVTSPPFNNFYGRGTDDVKSSEIVGGKSNVYTKIFDNDDMIAPNKPSKLSPSGKQLDDFFSKYDNYKSNHEKAIGSIDGSNDGGAAAQRPFSLRSHQKPAETANKRNRRSGSFAIISGIAITVAISCLIIFLLWKNYTNRTVKTMNFDNPVYRKTTEDHINLDDNKSIFSAASSNGGNGGLFNLGEFGRSGPGASLPARLGAAFNSKLRFSPIVIAPPTPSQAYYTNLSETNHHRQTGHSNTATTPNTPNGFGFNKTGGSPLHRLGLKGVVGSGLPNGGYNILNNHPTNDSTSSCALYEDPATTQSGGPLLNNPEQSKGSRYPSEPLSLNQQQQPPYRDDYDDGTVPFFPPK